ncbi:MAG: ABC transporter permease [SAR202 cluster bacterium]|nr:MAG: ABC transporter permease [SAR202 cluster bacterium]KAA1298006.1 MAG: ABC transporter permease [SAR202 cluster bacterium]
MLKYIFKRIIWMPVLLLMVSLIVFFLGVYGPGDPVEVQLGNNYDQESADRIREKMGLNDPVVIQWLNYVRKAAVGDFGESYVFKNREVSELLIPKLIVSAKLNIISFVIAIAIGTPLGFYAAVHNGTVRDPIVVIFSLVFYAMPVFFTAPFLILIFALQLDLVPAAGWGGVFDKRIILPAITIGIPGAAVFVRLIRSSMIEVLDTDYVKLARAKGVSENKVLWKHAFRNAMLPVVTIMGFSLAGLFGGSLIVEILFGIPGVGRISLDSVYSRDYPVIMAIVLLGSSALVVANLIIDFLYTLVDPRIELQ